MMAQEGQNSEMITSRNSVEGGNIEFGRITQQVGIMESELSPIETSLEKMEHVENNNMLVEEIDKWVDSLEKMLEDVPSYMCTRGHPGRISRIPENLREVDVKGYEPNILSIGPYHHGKQRVRSLEMRKKLVLKCVLKNKPELTIKDYLKEILTIEPIVRSFYSDIEMDSEKFLHMLLLDSVYIITTFCGMAKGQARMNEINTSVENEDSNAGENREENRIRDDDENLKMIVAADESDEGMSTAENWYWALLIHDLFLIENQVPFLLLQKIHSFAYGGSRTQFLDIMKYQVANMLTYYTRVDLNTVNLQSEDVHHLLHLGHMFFVPTIHQEFIACHFQESDQMFRLGSAVQLYEAGVEFDVTWGSTNYSLLDVTFDSSGKMAMPCLHVDDNTESLLRNLIALEQMKYPSMGLNISAYIVLLLHLITTPKDVELLRRKGIIQHHLASDKEMMYLVNRLSIGLAFDYVEDEYSLKQVFHGLKHYSERRVPRWRAWLKHRHFRNPWTAISLLAASLFLILTIVQTYYAVYSYYYPYFNGYP